MDPLGIADTADAPVSAQIVALVASGEATSRTDLARLLKLAPSTVSLRVQELIDAGVVDEGGAGTSRGGRKPRLLRLAASGGYVLVGDLGGQHARLGALDLTGKLHDVREVELDVRDGPEPALTALAAALEGLPPAGSALRGVALALPGPVDVTAGCVQSPSRMPGWQSFPVAAWLQDHFGVPAVVDNDANMIALGEHFMHEPRLLHSVTVKAGTAIGSGVIVAGALHRGASWAAGDITHTRVPAAGQAPCSCGNLGCLETIASGAALVRMAREAGVDLTTTAEVVRLACDGDPTVTTMVRSAGHHLGEVLCTVVDFFNPQAVFLDGALSTVDPFVAAVRSQLYAGCHPLATDNLLISRSVAGADAGILGAGRLILHHVIARPATTDPRDAATRRMTEEPATDA